MNIEELKFRTYYLKAYLKKHMESHNYWASVSDEDAMYADNSSMDKRRAAEHRRKANEYKSWLAAVEQLEEGSK